jgi:WD40 repeat protein
MHAEGCSPPRCCAWRDGGCLADREYTQPPLRRVWDTTGELKEVLQGHEKDVLCVAVSDDGRLAASGSDDHCVRCEGTGDAVGRILGRPHRRVVRRRSGWTIHDAQRRCHGCSSRVPHCAPSRGMSSWLPGHQAQAQQGWAALGRRVWDLVSGDCRHVLRPADNAVCSAAFLTGSHLLACGARGATLR